MYHSIFMTGSHLGAQYVNIDFPVIMKILSKILDAKHFNPRICTVAHLKKFKDPKMMQFRIQMRMYYLTWKHYRYRTLCHHIILSKLCFSIFAEVQTFGTNDRIDLNIVYWSTTTENQLNKRSKILWISLNVIMTAGVNPNYGFMNQSKIIDAYYK